MFPVAKKIRIAAEEEIEKPSTTIEKLPDKVLLEVFAFLSAKDLMKAMLVCKDWKRIIESSAATMMKFTLNCNDDKFPPKDVLPSNRKFQHIKIGGWPQCGYVAKQLWKFNASHIETAKIELIEGEDNDIDRFEHMDDDEFTDPVLEFLKRCKNLTSLEVDYNAFNALFVSGDMEEMDFKLNEFVLTPDEQGNSKLNYPTRLGLFLIKQASSLTKLRLSTRVENWDGSFTPSNPIVNEAIFRLSKLEVLDTNDDFMRNCLEFTSKQPMTSIREIDMMHTFESPAQFATFMQKFPNIESLHFPFDSDGIKIPDSVIELLLTKLTLRNLTIYGSDRSHHLLKVAFEKIKMNYGAMKTLEFKGLPGARSLKFEFPEDPALWNAQEQSERFYNCWPQPQPALRNSGNTLGNALKDRLERELLRMKQRMKQSLKKN